MQVLGILGSPRRGGNSEILLDRAMEGAKACGLKKEKIILNELKFVPCQECGRCNENGECAVKDDMRQVYRKVKEAQAIIIASPIFFGSLSAQLKAMIDRYQCQWVAKYVLGKKAKAAKKGALILVSAGNRASFFKNAESIVKNFFAVAGIKFVQQLYCPEVDGQAEVLAHPRCLKGAFELGKNIDKIAI